MSDLTSASRSRVTAILVVHDGANWLPEVVASLASQTRPIDYTFAIDTGSIDSSSKLLRNARVPYFSMPRESGFGTAVAAALENLPRSQSENEWLWLIHDDCAPQPSALEALLLAIENRPEVAIAGLKLRGWHDRSHLLEVGVSIAGNGARWTGLEAHEYDQGQHDGVRDVLSVSTAGMLIRKDVFEELGGFDPNLSLFRDDVDLGWRAHVAGHKVIVVTDAVAYHAEAASSERRSIDVKSSFFGRPLILDRRNAAYVMLANSSWWQLPWLAIQLFTSAVIRAAGYLLAKLPGYASDEILAVGFLIIRPGLIFRARKLRRQQRLISPRVVTTFIPPRWSQVRLGLLRLTETIRQALLPSNPEPSGANEFTTADEDLYLPMQRTHWQTFLLRPEIAGALFLVLVTSLWSAHRYGSLVGGALPSSSMGASDLWRRYGESWHQIGMGSSSATPTWIFLLALMATIFLGKVSALLSFIFWAAPVLFMYSMYSLLRKLSDNSALTVGASIVYAISPISIAAINSGRLGTIAALILAPPIASYLPRLGKIELVSWRLIFGFGLLIGLLSAFTLQAFAAIALFIFFGMVIDYRRHRRTHDLGLLRNRFYRRLTLVIVPFLLCLPWSFQALRHPVAFLTEPGLSLAGGGPNLALIGNPGGPSSLPWWMVSPIALILIVSIFSSSIARKYAEIGVATLVVATYLSILSISSQASSTQNRLWVGTLLAFASIAAFCAGVIILNGLTKRLASSHFHYRHVLAGLVIASTILYGVASSMWAVTAGTNSLVRANQEAILPPYLALTPGVKTLVLRDLHVVDLKTLSYFIARESDAILGDPDMAPPNSPAIDTAVREVADGTGINSSKVLAAHGIKFVFMKNPVDSQLVRVIDGLGGFVRMSSTQVGIVWRVSGINDRLVFTDSSGKSQPLLSSGVSARATAPGAGTLTLAENYDSGWKVIQGGKQLKRIRGSFGLPQFVVPQAGEFSLIHDGTSRRAWLSLEVIILLTVLIMLLPAGRRRSDIAPEERA